MPTRKRQGRRGLRSTDVAIVSTNPETLDGLETYLRAAGLGARGSSNVEAFAREPPPSMLAYVIFPDDFQWDVVIAALATLSELRTGALPVLVTAQPRRFAELTFGEPTIIVPRPVWGHQILDVIRAHRERPPADMEKFIE